MTDEIIAGLKDLIKDRESFINKEDRLDKDNIFIRDKEVLEKAIEMLLEKDKEIEKRDDKVKKIISRLNKDIEGITKAKEKYCDDYRRCRLKAYKTKTREIKEYIENQYFERMSEQF